MHTWWLFLTHSLKRWYAMDPGVNFVFCETVAVLKKWSSYRRTGAKQNRWRRRRKSFTRATWTTMTRTWISSMNALLSIAWCRLTSFPFVIYLFSLPKTLNPQILDSSNSSIYWGNSFFRNFQDCVVRTNRNWKECQPGIVYIFHTLSVPLILFVCVTCFRFLNF